MSEPAALQNVDPVSVEGLDDVFASTVDESSLDAGQTSDQGWSLVEAALAYGVTDRTVRRWIKQRRIPAWKVDGPRGPEWRIQPGPKPDTDDIQPGSLETTVDDPGDSAGLFFQLVRDLQNKLDAAQEQLKAASYRNGYLESQVIGLKAEVEGHRDTIKLLTDSQHKSSWWRRVWGAMRGASDR